MNYTKLPKKALLLLATPVMFSLAIPAGKLVAQSQTETKIRLMAEGLRARDSGDLATAKTNFEQLLVLAPNDVTVQRLLAGVNESISSGATAPAVEAPAVSSEPKEVVFDPSGKTAPTAPATAASSADATEVALPAAATASGEGAAAPLSPADALAQEEEARVNQLIADARAEGKVAKASGKEGDFDAASAKYDTAIRSLPVNTLTEPTISDLEDAKNELLLSKSQALLKQGDIAGAKAALDSYVAATSPEGKAARKQAARIDSAELNPPLQPIAKANPAYIPEQKQIAAMLSKGRSQYAAGDLDGARDTFRMVETYAADNAEAKYFIKRIAEDKSRLGTLNREKSRATLLEEVSGGWQRAGVFVEQPARPSIDDGKNDPLAKKMEAIIIPNVSFTDVELGRVISTLAALSEEYDVRSPEGQKGVNLVVSNPLSNASVPRVNITLRNMSLQQILDIVGEQAGYQIETRRDLVVVKPSGTNVNLLTEQFSINQGALRRMTGAGSASAATPAAAVDDPFAAPAAPAAGGGSTGGESEGIRRFLQAAGVPFDTVPGASLAYDGSGILVTQTDRNIEKIRNILARYNDVRQVEIEAKFMDVSEGALDDFGINWTQVAFTEGGVNYSFTGNNRSLANSFTSSNTTSSSGSVILPGEDPIVVPNSPPSIGTLNLSSETLAAVSGVFGDVSIDASIRALSRRQGTDLLSAPKVTVLSGNRATITIGQELIYPQSYGETESDVGSTSSQGSGSAGVTVTPGTPEDFTMRNVGVELAVTPTVEDDDYSIGLELNPRVTEFEGFVEYGGQSVAIAGGTLGSTVVTMPSGFYQPIFSTREINTRVTVWDGATLVMGGLTREEVRRVNDKIPVLGDIPFLGRAFQSKGEASSKRNLMIFVTANLVSPGGALKKQALKGVQPSSLFQNPTVATPGGSEARVRAEQR